MPGALDGPGQPGLASLLPGPCQGSGVTARAGYELAVQDGAGPFDVGIDSVGGSTTPAVWHKLTKYGTLIWCGQASRTPPRLDFFDWEGATSGTIRRFHYLEGDVPVAADLETLVRLVATGRLHPEIGSVESWDNTAAVIEALSARRIRGKAVLTITP